MPPETKPLCRHRSHDGTHRVISNSRTPPPGYELEFDLGVVGYFGAPGTARLLPLEDGSFRTVPSHEPVSDQDQLDSLGHIEQAPLPLLDALVMVRHRRTGDVLLISADDDPLRGDDIEAIATLGFVDSYPLNPRHPPHAELRYGSCALRRAIDTTARRHVYAVGDEALDAGSVATLGYLYTGDEPLTTALHRTAAGWYVTDSYQPDLTWRPRRVLRWVGAPASWGDVGTPVAKARAVGRRASDAVQLARRRPGAPGPVEGSPVGWLRTEPAEGFVPLYAAVHPVTHDQLLTTNRLEAADLGYEDIQRLGYVSEADDPQSRHGLPRAVPWASRFGERVRPAYIDSERPETVMSGANAGYRLVLDAERA